MGDAGVPYSVQYYQYGYSNPVQWTDASGQAVKTGTEQDTACTLAIFGQCIAHYILHPSDSRRAISHGGTTLIAFLERHAAVARQYKIDTDTTLRARLGTEYYDMVRADFYAWLTQDRLNRSGKNTPAAHEAYHASIAASGMMLALGAIHQATENLHLSGTLAATSVCQQAVPNRHLEDDITQDGTGTIANRNAAYAQLIRQKDWAQWGTNASTTAADDFTALAQSTTVQEALARIPKSWTVTRQQEGIGYVFTNPNATALVTEVRIKVPMGKFNPSNWYQFAQLRLGKYVGTEIGDPKFGMLYYDRQLNVTTNLDAMHIRLEFDP